MRELTVLTVLGFFPFLLSFLGTQSKMPGEGESNPSTCSKAKRRKEPVKQARFKSLLSVFPGEAGGFRGQRVLVA